MMTEDNEEAYNATGAEIKDFVERLLKKGEARKEIQAECKEIYEEAASTGLDKKALRALVRIATSDKDKLAVEETILQIYRDATGI